METYFVFSDETGDYKKSPGRKFLKSHPHFARVALGISVEDWMWMRDQFDDMIEEYNLPQDIELKWSHITGILGHRRRGEPIPSERDYCVFERFSGEELLGFVESALSMVSECESAWAVFTVTFNNRYIGIDRLRLFEMHVQDIMQRTEMELQQREGLGIILLDPKGKAEDDSIRNAYAKLYQNGDFIPKYNHIKDSIGFEISHHSFGIRLADYMLGTFNGWLNDYQASSALWGSYVWPIVRKSSEGDALGYGIIDVPKKSSWRAELEERLELLLEKL